MASLDIISGDYGTGICTINTKDLTLSFPNKQSLPISAFSKIEKNEESQTEIIFTVFIEEHLFRAKADITSFQLLHDIFLKKKENKLDNNPVVENKKIVVPPKEEKPKITLWGVFGIIIVIGMIGNFVNGGSKNSSNSGSSDLKVNAITYCQIAIEDAAKYGVKDPYGGMQVFPNSDGQSARVIMDIELKNGFGVWGKSRASCYFNGTSVTELVVDGKKLL